MELTVNTSKRYTIRIERGALDQLGAYCASLFAPGKKAVVITDTMLRRSIWSVSPPPCATRVLT